jgi:hypothetical protein
MLEVKDILENNIQLNQIKCEKILKARRKDVLKFFREYMGLNTPDILPEPRFVTQEDNLNFLLNTEFSDLNFEEIQQLSSLLNTLNSQYAVVDSAVSEEIYNLKKTIQKKLSEVEQRMELLKTRLFKKNLEFNNRAFGCYRYTVNRAISIEINFLSCIFFCNEYQLDLQKFILSTYVHELAHCFTHVGKDKDDSIWGNFREVDEEIKEGLAQYYTHEFFREKGWLENFKKETFLKDHEDQFIFNEVYREHEKYCKYSREQVYSSMIYIRRNKIVDHKQFYKVLHESSINLPYKFH